MHDKELKWLNVLLIDDSKPILEYVSMVLKDRFGINNIYSASSAPEALQILKHSKNINLLFIDLNMPGMDGIVLLEQIKQLEYHGYIVIMSGVSTKIISSVELLTKKHGLNYIGTLLKPMHEADFDNIINKIGVSRLQAEEHQQLKTYEIVRAIKSDNIEVLYQPQIELTSRDFIGVEALCRINHPRLGMVSPDKFIEKAEESELIVHITLSVLKKALEDWKKWQHYGLNIQLSVNASPIALQQPEFADTIFSLIDGVGMPPDKLCIEITESILAENQLQELMNVNRLSMRGVELALDDFGKEHSTVDRLQKLPLTYLKLDKGYFIENKNSLGQMSIINTSISLASKLNIKTIAEGVEDAAVLNLVTEMGCDYAQGFYIGLPMSAKKILSWARQWHDKT